MPRAGDAFRLLLDGCVPMVMLYPWIQRHMVTEGVLLRCSFTFDPENFPDPKAYLTEIKSKYNVEICVWINPYISQISPIFQEGVKGGYFIKRTDGSVWVSSSSSPPQWNLTNFGSNGICGNR